MQKFNRVFIFLAVTIVINFVGCSKNEKTEIENNKLILKEVMLESKERENFEHKDNYQVFEVIKKNEELYVHVEAELEDYQEAFNLGTFISESVKFANSEKLKEENIKAVKVFFNGMEKDLFFDGSNIIKEINQNWGAINEKNS